MIHKSLRNWRFPVLVIGMTYALVAGYLTLVLNHNFLQSDVWSYWNDSLNWQRPFHYYHVPGYPLMIALSRAVTLNTLPPVTLMMILNFAMLMISVVLVYKLIYNNNQSHRLAIIGAMLFGLWPFVGVVYAVVPLADIPSTTFFLLGLYGVTRKRFYLGIASWAMVLIIHKALWPLVAFSLLAFLWTNKPVTMRQMVLCLLVLLTPLILLWGFGAAYHNDPAWIISSNLQTEVASRGSLPIFDGLVGTFSQGEIKDSFKGVIVSGFTILASLLLYFSIRHRDLRDFYYGIAISAAILILFIAINQYEIWAAVRFSRLLVLPTAWIIGQRFSQKVFLRTGWLIAAFGALLFTQFAYAWYTALFWS